MLLHGRGPCPPEFAVPRLACVTLRARLGVHSFIRWRGENLSNTEKFFGEKPMRTVTAEVTRRKPGFGANLRLLTSAATSAERGCLVRVSRTVPTLGAEAFCAPMPQ